MKLHEAALILDPETTIVALAEIEYYAGFNGQAAKIKACEEACRIAATALRDIVKGQVCETCVHYLKDCQPLNPDKGCTAWKWRLSDGTNNH